MIFLGCNASSIKSLNRHGNPEEIVQFDFDGLEEKGRLQFFFHSPSSELPVRDILNKHKTEPHIEIGAENYIYCCYQPGNILPLLMSKEKYLFLFTTGTVKSSSVERIALFKEATTNHMMIYIILTNADLTEPSPNKL